MRKLLLYVGYALLAFGLSPLTFLMFPKIGNVIEPFVLIGVFLISRNSPFRVPFNEVFVSKQSVIVMLCLLAFALFGYVDCAWEEPNDSLFKNIYADFRCCLIFYYSFTLFDSKQWLLSDKISFLRSFLGFVILFCFLAYTERIIENAFGDYTTRTMGIPVHFLLIGMVVYNKPQDTLIQLVLLGLGFFYAVFSFARINILYFIFEVIAFIFIVFFSKSRSLLQSTKKYVFGLGILCVLFLIIPYAYDYYASSESGKAQMERSEDAIESGDRIRMNCVVVPFTDIGNFVLPHGLGWRNHIDKLTERYNGGVLSTQDSCFLYLFYHGGFVFGLWANILFLVRFVLRGVIECLSRFEKGQVLRLVIIVAFVIGYFTQGVYFTVPPMALAGGIMLFMIKPLIIRIIRTGGGKIYAIGKSVAKFLFKSTFVCLAK